MAAVTVYCSHRDVGSHFAVAVAGPHVRKSSRLVALTKRAGLSPLGELAGQERPAKVTARLWKAQREGAESQLHDLQEEIAEYERNGRDP